MEPTTIAANGAAMDGRIENLQAEVDRLRKSLHDAEVRLREVEDQRDRYYEYVKLWIEQNCRLSDWEDFDPVECNIPLQDVIEEIRSLKQD